MGNYRVLTNLSAELLAHAARRELTDAIENHYYSQIRRHYQTAHDRNLESGNDHDPPF
jgi:predicted solute-binding protein